MCQLPNGNASNQHAFDAGDIAQAGRTSGEVGVWILAERQKLLLKQELRVARLVGRRAWLR